MRQIAKALFVLLSAAFLGLSSPEAASAADCMSSLYCHIDDCYNSAQFYCELYHSGCTIMDASCLATPLCGGDVGLFCDVQ